MKNDNKVFVVYLLVILAYGASYMLTSGGKFAFSPEYSDFGLGLIALALFFNKVMNKYSILLVKWRCLLTFCHPTIQAWR